jgi:2-hydroxychromene-2-carboxylate isomerase
MSLPEEVERQQAEQAIHAKEQAIHAREQERQEKERLQAFLRSQGIDPDQLPE